MADSCLGAAGIAVINYAATLAMYLPVVVLQARRVTRRQLDPVIFKYYCHRRLPNQHEQQQPRDDQELFATPVMGLTSSISTRTDRCLPGMRLH